ncbi:ORF6N domain-containing protein [Thiomicrospira sp. ALE5]|uniref:ORF6N domain-containing protein n=1 Tax=Thiomicrospira sp. ALE5 TaxID=748650 RepID=UPI0008EFDF15|nr:ORF6N domain-containing protein [Thiomicrospira sp. ALE5]SFR49197.1 ORF6N domain-containing protein [Thiomicrospira sp. ALE5]
MNNEITIQEVQSKFIQLNNQQMLLDTDIAQLYQVETKRINEAVKNNPEKFPQGYIVELTDDDWSSLRSKISTLKSAGQGQHTKYKPKAFSEKGLYMLATILKSKRATETTLAIIEAFSKLRQLTRVVSQISSQETTPDEQKSLMTQSGELLAEIIDDGLTTTDSETTFELNFAVLKLKHTIKRKQK